MHYLFRRKCEIEGCKSFGKVVEVHFKGGGVKRICPQCFANGVTFCMQTPKEPQEPPRKAKS